MVLSKARPQREVLVARVEVSNRQQIVAPAAVGKQLRIEPGDYSLVEVRNGYVRLIPEPRDYRRHPSGLRREVREGVEPQDDVRRKREAWQG